MAGPEHTPRKPTNDAIEAKKIGLEYCKYKLPPDLQVFAMIGFCGDHFYNAKVGKEENQIEDKLEPADPDIILKRLKITTH